MLPLRALDLIRKVFNVKTGMKTDYRNVFLECGISKEDIEKRKQEIVKSFFYGKEEERLYFEVEGDMAYITDTGNDDVRTEGMSYGMMMCVQLDMKKEFDHLWKWAKTYMFMEEGFNEGYFAWSSKLNGEKNANGPAPDGEEFFAMALFFASHRWGNGEGIFNYERVAKEILSACLHKGEKGRTGTPMWNRENYEILFVPGIDFTDPSYHLPHFYELFALWANEEDRDFWKKAARKSREYLIEACNEKTGFSAEYAEFDGKPMKRKLPWTNDRHDWFFSDAYRTVANIGLDIEWFGVKLGQEKACKNIQKFLESSRDSKEYFVYEITGEKLQDKKILHPVGLPATIAQASLGLEELDETAQKWVLNLWNMNLRTGKWRYYDNCLYMFAFLALSGNYRIY